MVDRKRISSAGDVSKSVEEAYQQGDELRQSSIGIPVRARARDCTEGSRQHAVHAASPHGRVGRRRHPILAVIQPAHRQATVCRTWPFGVPTPAALAPSSGGRRRPARTVCPCTPSAPAPPPHPTIARATTLRARSCTSTPPLPWTRGRSSGCSPTRRSCGRGRARPKGAGLGPIRGPWRPKGGPSRGGPAACPGPARPPGGRAPCRPSWRIHKVYMTWTRAVSHGSGAPPTSRRITSDILPPPPTACRLACRCKQSCWQGARPAGRRGAPGKCAPGAGSFYSAFGTKA
eukprot:scaffold1_cov402-Prasinococcus_capsulatus_cf.AAC.76